MGFKHKLKGKKVTVRELFFATKATRYLRDFIWKAKTELEIALEVARDLFVYGEFDIKITD